MPIQQADEKRVHQRVVFNRLVRINFYAGNTIKVIGVNYSSSGMALNSKMPLPVGEYFELDFRLSEQNKQDFSITAEVVQNIKRGEMYITGVKFLGELEH